MIVEIRIQHKRNPSQLPYCVSQSGHPGVWTQGWVAPSSLSEMTRANGVVFTIQLTYSRHLADLPKRTAAPDGSRATRKLARRRVGGSWQTPVQSAGERVNGSAGQSSLIQ